MRHTVQVTVLAGVSRAPLLFLLRLSDVLQFFRVCQRFLLRHNREPLLAQGLLGVLDISLRDEVVVGFTTCGGVLFGQGAQLLSGSARAC